MQTSSAIGQRLWILAAMLVALLAFSACSEKNQDQSGAEELWGRVNAEYRTWGSPWPFSERQPSHTLHADEVQIYFNAPMEELNRGLLHCDRRVESSTLPGAPAPESSSFFLHREEPDPSSPDLVTFTPQSDPSAAPVAWPVGSVIVKEGYSGSDLDHIAIMEKRDDGWFFAEYNNSGEVLFSGKPEICLSCHSGALHDSVFAAQLFIKCRGANNSIYDEIDSSTFNP